MVGHRTARQRRSTAPFDGWCVAMARGGFSCHYKGKAVLSGGRWWAREAGMNNSSHTTEPASMADCRQVFGAYPFGEVLTDVDVRELLPLARLCLFRAGATLFYEDDDTDAVYFIVDGAVEVFKSDHSGKKLPLTILRGQGVLGEIGVLNGAPRNATARALTPVRAICFDSAEFFGALATGHPAAYRLVLALARVLAQRLSAMDDQMFELAAIDPEHPEQELKIKQDLIAGYTV
jgi:Cyclic nucleotide-binding domain